MKFLASILFLLTAAAVTLCQAPFPIPVNSVAPTYPAAARAVRAEGTVRVALAVDNRGRVIAATAETGHPLLRTASVDAASAWTFRPSPGTHFINIAFTFRIGHDLRADRVKLRGPYSLELTGTAARIDE
jgi:TonB family protein